MMKLHTRAGDSVLIEGDGNGNGVSVIVRNYDSNLEVVAVDEGGAAFDAVPVQSLMADRSPEPLDVLREALEAWANEFDAKPDADGMMPDYHIGGADLVDWFAGWRERARQAVAAAEGRA